MPTTYTAQAGDSLCNIAYVNGLPDCTALRGEAANAFIVNRATDPAQVKPGDVVTIPDALEKQEDGSTEKKHIFVKRGTMATIRFTHGSPNLPYADDPSLAILNISNYGTDRGNNPDGSSPFPAFDFRRFHAHGDRDRDTFKVEVLDIKASGLLDVEIEALCPTYNAAGAVTGHKSFADTDAAKRKLASKAEKQGTTQRFRTGYLRLVTDKVDKAAADKQTVMTSDLVDANQKQVEILDQLVKASYVIPSCTQNPKCTASAELPIGTDRRRLRIAVHVLRLTPGGALVVQLNDAEKRVLKWVRRTYAQAAIAPKLTQAVRAVDPPENMVSIGNDSGLTAAGDGQLRFRINATGKASQVIGPITPTAGDTPLTTANALAALIAAPYSAAVSQNSARLNDPVGRKSADIVITEATGVRVTIDQVLTLDSRQTLSVGRANPANLQSWAVPAGNNNWNVGSLEQRTVLRNHDTGDNLVDVFVVTNVTAGNRAEAMMSGHRIDANRPAGPQVLFSAFMTAITMDGTNNNPFVLSHEIGHVLGEVVHSPAANPPAEVSVMDANGTEVANAANASKRIRDGATTFDGPPGQFNLITRMRIEGAPLLEPW